MRDNYELFDLETPRSRQYLPGMQLHVSNYSNTNLSVLLFLQIGNGMVKYTVKQHVYAMLVIGNGNYVWMCIEKPVRLVPCRLRYFEEVFTSEHWMMRIYRVLPEPNRETKLKNPRRARVATKRSAARLKRRLPSGAVPK